MWLNFMYMQNIGPVFFYYLADTTFRKAEWGQLASPVILIFTNVVLMHNVNLTYRWFKTPVGSGIMSMGLVKD